jgi:hypothetical protein
LQQQLQVENIQTGKVDIQIKKKTNNDLIQPHVTIVFPHYHPPHIDGDNDDEPIKMDEMGVGKHISSDILLCDPSVPFLNQVGPIVFLNDKVIETCVFPCIIENRIDLCKVGFSLLILWDPSLEKCDEMY